MSKTDVETTAISHKREKIIISTEAVEGDNWIAKCEFQGKPIQTKPESTVTEALNRLKRYISDEMFNLGKERGEDYIFAMNPSYLKKPNPKKPYRAKSKNNQTTQSD